MISAPLDEKVVIQGTHRVRTFAETWAAVRPMLGAMGITRVANVTGLDDVGIPVVMVCRPNASSLAVTQGKGLTLKAARLSGVMEAAELFHAEDVGLQLHEASPNALARSGVSIDVDRLSRHLSAPLDRDRAIAWVAGRSLVSGERRWVPYECVQVGRIRHWERTFAMTSSGLASGNSRGEALSHAICELAERHGQAIWKGLPRVLKAATRVDLDTVSDPSCQRLLTRLARTGLAVGIWNLTCEIGLPTFTCSLTQRHSRYPRALPPAAGSGCHPDRAVALARAITEAAQSRVTHIAGAREDMSDEQYTVRANAESVRRTLELIAAEPGQPVDRITSHRAERVSADVDWELTRLERASIGEAVAVDLTRAEFGLPVVRVIIPGLEHPPPPSHLFAPGARA
jgi:YcaO-like protein with predicted kinase domain